MRGASFVTGAVVASLAAGPMVWLPAAGIQSLSTSLPTYWAVGGLVGGVLVALPIGFVVALPFNLGGAAMLAAAGRRFPAARHPAAWLGAGAVIGEVLGTALGGGSANAAVPSLLVAALGAANAGICRWFTRWDD